MIQLTECSKNGSPAVKNSVNSDVIFCTNPIFTLENIEKEEIVCLKLWSRKCRWLSVVWERWSYAPKNAESVLEQSLISQNISCSQTACRCVGWNILNGSPQTSFPSVVLMRSTSACQTYASSFSCFLASVRWTVCSDVNDFYGLCQIFSLVKWC